MHPMLFQNPGYEHGDTLLHKVIRGFSHETTSDVIDKLIKEHGEAAISAMSLITNDEGMTPIRLLGQHFNSLNGAVYSGVKSRLEKLMIPRDIKDISTEVTMKDVKSDLDLKVNVRLENNLKLAVYLANETRKFIKKSGTHPELNNFSAFVKSEIRNLVLKLRNEIDSFSFYDDQAEYVAELAKKAGCGNCYEFSFVAVEIIKGIDPGVSAEVVAYENGDHVFVVIDRVAGSTLRDSLTWGSFAVICDAWAGEVYPAGQMPFKLRDFTSSNSNNLLTTYNPRFHRLNLLYSNDITVAAPHQSEKFKSLFTKKRTHKIKKETDANNDTEIAHVRKRRG